MLIGYLVLAGTPIVHWLLDGPDTKIGRSVMWLLFVGGIAVQPGIHSRRGSAGPGGHAAGGRGDRHLHDPHVAEGQAVELDRTGGAETSARLSSVFLIIGVALLAYVVHRVAAFERHEFAGATQTAVSESCGL